MAQTGTTDQSSVIVLPHSVLHSSLLRRAHEEAIFEWAHGDGIGRLECVRTAIVLGDLVSQVGQPLTCVLGHLLLAEVGRVPTEHQT